MSSPVVTRWRPKNSLVCCRGRHSVDLLRFCRSTSTGSQRICLPSLGSRAHGLRLIEDCAQSHGALYRERPTGSFGDVGCFSFYPTKNLGALGDGGMVATNQPDLGVALREIREYGWRDRYVSARTGINSRLDSIQAAVLSVKLTTLAADNARRQAIADRYDVGLAELPLALPSRRPEATHIFHQYVIRLVERDALREKLRSGGIGSGIHYPMPVHRQPAYRGRLACGP